MQFNIIFLFIIIIILNTLTLMTYSTNAHLHSANKGTMHTNNVMHFDMTVTNSFRNKNRIAFTDSNVLQYSI